MCRRNSHYLPSAADCSVNGWLECIPNDDIGNFKWYSDIPYRVRRIYREQGTKRHFSPCTPELSSTDVVSCSLCLLRACLTGGVKAFWRGNLVNCLRYAPLQGSTLALNDMFNNMLPKYDAGRTLAVR